LKRKLSKLLLPPLLAPLPPTASQHCFQCQIQALPREPSGWNNQGPRDPGFVGARFLIPCSKWARRYARSESLGPPSAPPQPPSLPPLFLSFAPSGPQSRTMVRKEHKQLCGFLGSCQGPEGFRSVYLLEMLLGHFSVFSKMDSHLESALGPHHRNIMVMQLL